MQHRSPWNRSRAAGTVLALDRPVAGVYVPRSSATGVLYRVVRTRLTGFLDLMDRPMECRNFERFNAQKIAQQATLMHGYYFLALATRLAQVVEALKRIARDCDWALDQHVA
jgi:hypothetical protein